MKKSDAKLTSFLRLLEELLERKKSGAISDEQFFEEYDRISRLWGTLRLKRDSRRQKTRLSSSNFPNYRELYNQRLIDADDEQRQRKEASFKP